MDGLDHDRRTTTRKMTLKEWLGLKGLNCCGATCGFRPTAVRFRDDDEGQESELQHQRQEEEMETINAVIRDVQPGRISDIGCWGRSPNLAASASMNLAAALAAERQFHEGANDVNRNINVNNVTAPATPSRMSLMRLLEETECGDGHGETRETEGAVGSDTTCCVCMVRKKGAAFIACGHTFCRVCSRDLWLNRGFCPLCNQSILRILDIF